MVGWVVMRAGEPHAQDAKHHILELGFVVQPRCGWNGVVGAPTQGALRDPGLCCATALRLAWGGLRWGRTMWPWLRNAEGVQQQSPGSRSAPWVRGLCVCPNPNGVVQRTRRAPSRPREGVWLCNRVAVGAGWWGVNPGCAARPWALLYNRVAVGVGQPALGTYDVAMVA